MIPALEIMFGFIADRRRGLGRLIRDSYGKLISLGVLVGGIVPFIVDRGYLDVAITVSLVALSPQYFS